MDTRIIGKPRIKETFTIDSAIKTVLMMPYLVTSFLSLYDCIVLSITNKTYFQLMTALCLKKCEQRHIRILIYVCDI